MNREECRIIRNDTGDIYWGVTYFYARYYERSNKTSYKFEFSSNDRMSDNLVFMYNCNGNMTLGDVKNDISIHELAREFFNRMFAPELSISFDLEKNYYCFGKSDILWKYYQEHREKFGS